MVDFSCHSRSEISDTKAFNAAGRFEAEYVTLKKLGRGGFSSVYMVKNLLDDSLSAVKKIVIRVNNTNKHNIQNEVKSALQEIRTLANIRSEHVVIYKHSWIEVKLKDDIFTDEKDSYFENKEESFELSYNNNNSTHKANKEDDLIEFLESSKNSFKNDEPSFKSNRRTTLKSLNLPCHSNKILLGSVEYDVDNIENLTIFIQMELCKETLHDYIERRNSMYNGNMKEFFEKEEKEILRLFSEICKGLEHIHSKENLIHRDLKPKNIFFTENGKLKLGDFGLATKSCLGSEMIAASPLNITPRPDIPSPNKISPSCQTSTRFSFDTSFTSEFHTKNIGTLLYAAPEQINSNNYDQKADMYSLGLILFDLAYPVKTVMEKQKMFENVKKGFIPTIIKEQMPLIHKLLISLISEEPTSRPKPKEILFILNESLSHYNRQVDLKSLSSSKKRKRFLSEDVQKVTPQKMLVKIEDGDGRSHWKNMWVKVINDRVLFFQSKDSSKASMSYDLKECEVSGRFIEESERVFGRKNNFSSTCELCGFTQKSQGFLKKRSLSLNHNIDKKESFDRSELINQLNYMVGIEHPYMQKCYLKCKHLIDSMEFYNKIANIE